MEPITDFKELIRTTSLTDERWFILLLINPNNPTDSTRSFLENLEYLKLRTENITFFLPGFKNADDKIINSDNSFFLPGPVSFSFFGKHHYHFDPKGFYSTIKWLEEGSNNSYQYSECLDLVILKYRPFSEKNFDFQNMIFYDLDSLNNKGININKFINECKNVTINAQSENDIKQKLDSFIFKRPGENQQINDINVFVAGSKKLKRERDAVISALTHITNISSKRFHFIIKTFEDFDRSIIEDGRQKEYNNFIRDNAKYAIFILDNNVGGVTFEEFKVALEAYKTHKRPEIFVYSHKEKGSTALSNNLNPENHEDHDINTIRQYLSEINQYYIEYYDLDDLKYNINQDFRKYSI